MRSQLRLGLFTVLAGVLMLPAVPAVATGGPRVVVVDDDGVQCPDAGYKSIQQAIDAAVAGDTVHVCGGSYAGDVTVDKAVKLTALAPAAPDLDCFGDGAPPPGSAVIAGAVTLGKNASGTTIDGFVIAGTTTGITTSDQGSGYQIRRNVLEGSSTFAIHFGSVGDQTSVVTRNCFRGVVGGPERVGLYADESDLRNAVVSANSFVNLSEAMSVDGEHYYSDIRIVHNVVKRTRVGFLICGVVSGEVSHNDIDTTEAAEQPSLGIIVGGGNIGLIVDANRLKGGTPSIGVNRLANYTNPNSNVGLVISRNRISNSGSGINIRFPEPSALPNVTHGLLYRNEATGGTNSGIVVAAGNDDNVLIGNRLNGNARYGIWLAAVPGYPPVTGTVAVGNTMLGNGLADARDDARPQSTWLANRCVTQIPPDANICGGDRRGLSAVARSTSAALPSIPRPPAVDRTTWPCLGVPVWEFDPADGGAWTRTAVVAPDAPAGTTCGS
ncbi:hypothetical protein ACVBEQ_22275 [Nakamurella sp. GG22]